MKMSKLQVKKIISLGLIGSYIVFTGYETYLSGNISEGFKTLVAMVGAYYFGRSHGEEK